MGITNTIAKLKAYFEAWHSESGKHEYLDNEIDNIKNKIATLNSIWNETYNNNPQLSLLSKIYQLINKFNALTYGAENTTIKDINTALSTKANKAWSKQTLCQIIVDGNDFDSVLRYNDDLKIGVLYFSIDLNEANKNYAVNSYGYTAWIDVKAAMMPHKPTSTSMDILKRKRPTGTFSCFDVSGRHKIRFGPVTGGDGYQILCSHFGKIDKDDIVNVRGTVLYYYGD